MLYTMLAWVAGAAFGLLQMIFAAISVARIRRQSPPVGDANLCRALSRSLGIRHAVDVLEADSGTMPMTFGMLRNTILLPADAADWSEERRRVVLLHELAHVRRGDTASHVLARVALSLNWWNPLAWTTWRRVPQGARMCHRRPGFTGRRARFRLCRASAGCGPDDAKRPCHGMGCYRHGPAVAIGRPAPRQFSIPRWPAAAPAAPARVSRHLLAVAAVRAAGRAVQSQDSVAQTMAPDVDATIRAAISQKNHQMLENAAGAFENLRQFDTAQKLLESAVAIRAEVSGAQSADYGIGLLKLGELEQRRNRDKSAEDFFQRAAQILGDRPEAAKALLCLGTSAFIRKDYQTAVDHFQHVQAIDPSQAGAACAMWVALVRERRREFRREAEAPFPERAGSPGASLPGRSNYPGSIRPTLASAGHRLDEAAGDGNQCHRRCANPRYVPESHRHPPNRC